MRVKKLWIITGVQMIVLILLITCWQMACRKPMRMVDVLLDKWRTDKAVWTDADGWACPDGIISTITSPFLSILRGTYTLEVEYTSNSYETMTMTAPENMHYFVHGGNIRLYPLQHIVRTDFTVDQGIDNLVLGLTTSGKGEVGIHQIQIVQNRNDLGQLCALYAVCILLIDFYLIQKKIWHWDRHLTLGFYALLLFASLPLFMPGIQVGHDIRFHFMRLEGLWRELASGHIPSRVQSAWFDGYGYPVSIYYGDLLLYPAAILRIMGVPLIKAYKSYLFMINYLTVLTAILCFRRMSGSDWKTLLLSAGYILANYRLYDVYIRAGAGEMSAFIFYPVIMLGFYEMITCHGFSWRVTLQDSMLIATGIAGIICNHMLSGEITLIAFAIICLFYLPSVLKKQGIVTLGIGAVFSILLSAYYVVPFLDTYRSIDVTVQGSLTGGNGHMIQQLGAFWGQYFAFTEKIDGYSVEDAATRFALTPGPLLITALLLGIAAVYLNLNRKRIWRPVILAIMMLFISSDLFPWNVLALHTRVGRIIAQVQFPWRYLMIVVVLLSAVLYVLLTHPVSEHYKLPIILVAVLICGYSTCDYLSQYISGATVTNVWDMGEISNSAAMNYEYWRQGTDGGLFEEGIAVTDGVEAEIVERNGLRFILDCKAEKDGMITLPQVNYGNMVVTMENGQRMAAMDGKNLQVTIPVSAGYQGRIISDYEEPILWRISELISVISLICCVCIIRRSRRYLNVAVNRAPI